MFKKFAAVVFAAASAAATDNTIILSPPGTTGPDVAVIWIHGAECPNTGYKTLAQELQNQMAANKTPTKTWIGIPQFPLKSPDPVSINIYVKSTLKDLIAAGFTGDNIMLAGHSLGGVMAQKYSAGNMSQIKGLITMGSTITRDNRKMNKDGTTHINNVPTLTIGGTKDGLMRISRIAESWYHGRENIESAQNWMFPVIALDGVSHMQFSSGTPPTNVLNHDLKPEVTEKVAHQEIAKSMSDFIETIIHKDTTAPKQIDSGNSE
jgi:predicted alpha/beta-hydrolase family hydrolase